MESACLRQRAVGRRPRHAAAVEHIEKAECFRVHGQPEENKAAPDQLRARLHRSETCEDLADKTSAPVEEDHTRLRQATFSILSKYQRESESANITQTNVQTRSDDKLLSFAPKDAMKELLAVTT